MWSVGIFPWERTELVFTVAPNTAARAVEWVTGGGQCGGR